MGKRGKSGYLSLFEKRIARGKTQRKKVLALRGKKEEKI